MKIVIIVFLSLFRVSSSQLLISNSGPCACDLTANMCDNNCCCDPNCSSFQIQSFTCTNSLISPTSYGCFPSELLFQNNTAYLNATVGNLFCVYHDNYTVRNFYVAPTILTSTNISSFTPTGSLPTLTTTFNVANLFSASIYTKGANIYTVIKGSSVGVLSLSRPGIDGACVNGLMVGYLNNELTSCTRVITNITTDCSTLPGIGFYYNPGMVVPAYPLVMNTLFYAYSSFSTDIYFAPVTCVGCNGNTLTSLNSRVCNDVVTQVNYQISGELNITSVVLTLTVANVSATFSQLFNVTFIKSGFTTTGIARSGNPGYLEGYPVLSVTSNGNIQNLSMISGGDCGTGSSTAVLFGFNSHGDCSVNVSTFNNNCLNINNNVNASFSSYFAPFLMPYGNLSQVNLVSRVANDDVYNSAATNPCIVISKLTVYIIYARTGTLTLPQNEIIGYQTSYSYSSLPTNNQLYWVSVSVKFVDNSQTLFDLSGLVARVHAQNTVKDFLYLLYVESAAYPLVYISKTYLTLLLIQLFFFL